MCDREDGAFVVGDAAGVEVAVCTCVGRGSVSISLVNPEQGGKNGIKQRKREKWGKKRTHRSTPGVEVDVEH